eukprot:6199988-Pleurochrysis_carterae.AAC.2
MPGPPAVPRNSSKWAAVRQLHRHASSRRLHSVKSRGERGVGGGNCAAEPANHSAADAPYTPAHGCSYEILV